MLKKADLLFVALATILLQSCSDYRRNDYEDNSPTSGQLKVYYDEGLETHVTNQTLTFESQYERASVELKRSNDDDAVMALYNDSCKAIVISRLLNEKEKTLFASREYTPKYTLVAYSGVALLSSNRTGLSCLSKTALKQVLLGQNTLSDSSGNKISAQIVIDKNNSSVMRYLIDSVMGTAKFGPNCSSLGSTPETIRYVASHDNVIGIVDFAWLSDRDDVFYRQMEDSIHFLAVSESYREETLPNQSTFKLKTYPLMRAVYVMRNAGEFTLAKGFESFVSGPKGQLTFLKQGLLPGRQPGRAVEIKIEK